MLPASAARCMSPYTSTRSILPALALIPSSQPWRSRTWTLPAFVYDSVKVGPTVPLAAIAKASGTSVEQILELNPQILRGMTPPRDSVRIRIPVGAKGSFDSVLKALTPEERVGVRRVLTKKGDYPETVAERYGIRTRQVLLFNPKAEQSKKTGRLAAGQVMLIPTPAMFVWLFTSFS